MEQTKLILQAAPSASDVVGVAKGISDFGMMAIAAAGSDGTQKVFQPSHRRARAVRNRRRNRGTIMREGGSAMRRLCVGSM